MRNLIDQIITSKDNLYLQDIEKRAVQLCYRINLMMFGFMFFLGILNSILSQLGVMGPIYVGTYRLFAIAGLNIFLIILVRLNYHQLVKYLLIFVPPLIFLIMPTLMGFVQEESYFYYPFVAIAFSIIPHMILVPKKDKIIKIIAVTYFALLVVSIDLLLNYFKPPHIEAFNLIQEFYLFYKLSSVIIFVFLTMAVSYLQGLNYKSDVKIKMINFELENQNEELKSIISNLEETQMHLIQSEKMASLGTLTGGVAHELNNPLNFINGGLQVLKKFKVNIEDILKPDQKKTLDTLIDLIHAGTKESTNIVKSLSSFSFRESSKIKNVNIHDIIDNTLLFLRSKTTKIQIDNKYTLDKNLWVYPDKLHQVFLNIFNNAIYELQNLDKVNDKRITVQTLADRHNKNMASIIISNTGHQIPEDIIHKIFDPFFTTKEVGEGKGLGLSIAYSFIEDHQGKLYAENTDEGVAFIIELPL